MDFHSMKRKQLQALCKKHNIPANLSNLEMANKLTEFLKEKEDPLIQRPIQGQYENVSETQSVDVVVNRKVKKVRFSPDHELIEFTRSPELKRRNARNSVYGRYSSWLIENVDSSEMKKENLGGEGRTTRSRGLKLMESKVNEKKRGRNAAKCIDKSNNASAVEIFDNGKMKEGDVDSSGRVMLLRGKMLEESKKNASKRENKRAKDDDRRDEKTLDIVDNGKLIQEIVVNPGRVTRSRVQKLTEVSAKEEKRGRKSAKGVGNVALVSAETDENRVAATSSFMNRGDVGEGKLARDSGEGVKCNGKGEEVLENKKIAGEHDVTEPQIFLRRSKRNANMVADSEILNVDSKKHEIGESKGLRKTSKLFASDGSGVDGETGNEVNLGRRAVLKTEEPKMETRRSNRRKNVIESDELKAETENRHTLSSSVPQLGIAGEVSKDEKKVIQPTGVMRRSRHKTLSLKLVSANEEIDTDFAVENLEEETENRCLLRSSVPQLGIAGGASKEGKKVLQPCGVMRRSRHKTLNLTLVSANENIDTDAAVENLEEEKNRGEPCEEEKECSVQKNARRSRRIASKCKSPGLPDETGGVSIIHQKYKALKRKKGPISGGDAIKTNNDPSSVAETMKESSSKKAVPGAATGKVADADTRKRTCRLNDFRLLDASSHNGLESGELFLTNSKPSASEGLGSTSNLGFSTGTSPKNIFSDVGPTSGRKTPGKKSDISTADSAESSDIELINGKELPNSNTNAASRNAELKIDFTDFEEDKLSASNIRGVEKGNSALEIDVHESIEQIIIDMEKNNPEAHVLSQEENLGCNNKIDNQVLPEDSNVSGNEGFDETGSSTDCLLPGDQTDINTDVAVAEAEVDKCLRPSPTVVDHVNEVKGISVQESLDSDGTRKDNNVLPQDSISSEKEGFAGTASPADNLLPADVEMAEVEAEKCLQPNPSVVDRVGEVEGISAQENLDSDESRQDNQVLPDGLSVSGKEGFAETGFSADKLLLGDQTDIRTDIEVAEAEADKCLQPSPNVIDHVGEVKGTSIQKNLESDETREDNQVLSEGSNEFRKEGFAETGSFADCLIDGDQRDIKIDLEVAEAEANNCLQPSPSLVDHVGEVQGISVLENLNSDETGQENQVLQEGSNVCGNEGFAKTNTSADGLLLGDQTDTKNQAKGGNPLQPSPSVVDHVSEVKGISVQENLNSEEARQTDDINSPVSRHQIVDHLEASDNILDNNNEDTSPKAGEVWAVEPCEMRIGFTHSKIELEEPSSCLLRRVEGDIMAEGNEAFFHKGIASELAKANEDGCLDTHESASYQYSEFGVPDLSDVERSARIVQDRAIFSGEYSVLNSDEQGKYPDSLAGKPIMSGTNSTEINLMRCHEAEREETCTNESSNSEDDQTVEGGSSDGHKSKCDEVEEFSVSTLFDSEGRPVITPQDKEIISGEHFNEQVMFHEADLIAEGNEAYIYKDKQSELIDAVGNGCLESHVSSKDEDWEFTISNLFDVEKSARITPQDRGIASPGYSIKDFNEQVMFPDLSAVSTTCANYSEVKLNADSSNLQEISPSKSIAVNESRDQPKSPLAEPTAVANTIQLSEAGTNASETAGHAMCLLETTAQGNICPVVEGSSTDEDANDANCGKDKENSAGACITDFRISTDRTISKTGVEIDMKFQETDETEQQSKNLLASQTLPVLGEEPTDVEYIQSWTGVELHNLFGTTLDNDTPGLNDASSQVTEIASLTMSASKSISNDCGMLSKKEKGMEGERRSECVKITNENGVLPTTFNEVSHSGFDADREENQLATPIIVAPCKIDETSSHDRKLDRTPISVMECFDTMKENAATPNKYDEKDQHAGYKFENSFCHGDPLSGIGEEVTCEELNQVESVELVNASTTILSEAECDGCEAFKEQLTENTGDCLKETNSITEEDKEETIIPLGESCLFDKASDSDSELAEKNISSSSGSPWNLDKLEGCQDMFIDTEFSESLSCKSRVYHKSEGEMTESSEAAFELSDADLQKSNIPEKSNHLIACIEDGNILRETSIETFRGPLDAEAATIGSFDGQNDVIDKGTSPCHFSKFSSDYDEVTEREDSIKEDDDPYATKIQDETGGNSRSSQDISDELHASNEVVILELQSTCKEAKETVTTTQNVDNIVASAEHGSSVYCAVSDTLSSSAMHLHQEDHENGDNEKSEAVRPIFNIEGDDEKNGKELEESSTATMVQFSVSQLHFEEKVEDLKNHSHSITDVPSSGYNEILKESDVADTIREYIDSESSLPMIFETSGASPAINIVSHTNERTAYENVALCESDKDVANCESEDYKPSVNCLETESKELEEATLFIEPASGSGEAVKSPACVDFLAEGSIATKQLVETKGFDMKLDSQEQIESEDGHKSSSKQWCSTVKKNARTILIHGTPGKLLAMADMKENAPTRKSSNIGDLTTARPAKRRALQDVQWK